MYLYKDKRLLECFSVKGSNALFFVLPLTEPHPLEGVQGGQDTASYPRRVEPLGRGGDPDLNVLRSNLLHLRQ